MGIQKTDILRLQALVNKWLRKIIGIYCPDTISNKDMRYNTNQEPIEITIF